MSRDPNDLTPLLKILNERFLLVCKERGTPCINTYTLRTSLEQEALYAQHREPLDAVNARRTKAGMPPITEAQNAFCVTWTMKSKHLPGPDGKSRAFDVCLVDAQGHAVWNPKADGDHNGVPDWKDIADLGKSMGLVPGYYFPEMHRGKNRDSAHFELAP